MTMSELKHKFKLPHLHIFPSGEKGRGRKKSTPSQIFFSNTFYNFLDIIWAHVHAAWPFAYHAKCIF
jgi:hypothetical protein